MSDDDMKAKGEEGAVDSQDQDQDGAERIPLAEGVEDVVESTEPEIDLDCKYSK
jgi:hypothetical protein